MSEWRRGRAAFKNGPGFPNEQFVQEVIEWHFSEMGFVDDLSVELQLDLAGVHPDKGTCWRVEAKGDTRANCGTDFHQGLGQLLRKMRDPSHHHGLALPDVQRYRTLILEVTPHVRQVLNLYWILVREDEGIVIQAPNGEREVHSSPSSPVSTRLNH